MTHDANIVGAGLLCPRGDVWLWRGFGVAFGFSLTSAASAFTAPNFAPIVQALEVGGVIKALMSVATLGIGVLVAALGCAYILRLVGIELPQEKAKSKRQTRQRHWSDPNPQSKAGRELTAKWKAERAGERAATRREIREWDASVQSRRVKNGEGKLASLDYRDPDFYKNRPRDDR